MRARARGERVDEEIHRRAGAHADDGVVLDVGERRFGGGLLQRVWRPSGKHNPRRRGSPGALGYACGLATRARMKTESYLEKILTAKVYDVAIESPLEPGARALAPHWATTCCSSARTSSRCSRSSCAGPTTRWRTSAPAQLARGVICASGRQPCAGRGARGAEAGRRGDDRDAGHHAAHQGGRGGGARREGGAARRQLPRGVRCTPGRSRASAASPSCIPTTIRW